MIHITKRAWRHIMRHHIASQFTRHKSKSKFYLSVDLMDLLNKAAALPAYPYKGNLQRVLDVGMPIGIDRDTGMPTAIVTIFTRPNGDLVTMFPGRR
ncbi:hypothetical protein [Duganella sacchari]|uniref:hypothetical protein n=1 Tax=Duganella sacchari TaxID=551987 RepID=UPI001114D1E7|nr:hypothetical protein [Duganella sacchari]